MAQIVCQVAALDWFSVDTVRGKAQINSVFYVSRARYSNLRETRHGNRQRRAKNRHAAVP